jgi:hypothetical protein
MALDVLDRKQLIKDRKEFQKENSKLIELRDAVDGLSRDITEGISTAAEWEGYADSVYRLDQFITKHWTDQSLSNTRKQEVRRVIAASIAAFRLQYGIGLDEVKVENGQLVPHERIYAIDISDPETRISALNLFTRLADLAKQLGVNEEEIDANTDALNRPRIVPQIREIEAQIPAVDNIDIVQNITPEILAIKRKDADPLNQIKYILLGDEVVDTDPATNTLRIREIEPHLPHYMQRLRELRNEERAILARINAEQQATNEQATLENLDRELQANLKYQEAVARDLYIELHLLWTTLNVLELGDYKFDEDIDSPEEKFQAFRIKVIQPVKRELDKLLDEIEALEVGVDFEIFARPYGEYLRKARALLSGSERGTNVISLASIESRARDESADMQEMIEWKESAEQSKKSAIKLNTMANPFERAADIKELGSLLQKLFTHRAALSEGQRLQLNDVVTHIEKVWKELERLVTNKFSNIQDDLQAYELDNLLPQEVHENGQIVTHMGYLDQLRGLVVASLYLTPEQKNRLVVRIEELRAQVERVVEVVAVAPDIDVYTKELPPAANRLEAWNPLSWQNRFKPLIAELTKDGVYTLEKIASFTHLEFMDLFNLLRTIRSMVNTKVEWEKIEPFIAQSRSVLNQFEEILIKLDTGATIIQSVAPGALRETVVEMRQIHADIEDRYRRARDPFYKTFKSLMKDLNIDLSLGLTSEMAVRVMQALRQVQSTVQDNTWADVISEHRIAIRNALGAWQRRDWNQITIVNKLPFRNLVNEVLTLVSAQDPGATQVPIATRQFTPPAPPSTPAPPDLLRDEFEGAKDIQKISKFIELVDYHVRHNYLDATRAAIGSPETDLSGLDIIISVNQGSTSQEIAELYAKAVRLRPFVQKIIDQKPNYVQQLAQESIRMREAAPQVVGYIRTALSNRQFRPLIDDMKKKGTVIRYPAATSDIEAQQLLISRIEGDLVEQSVDRFDIDYVQEGDAFAAIAPTLNIDFTGVEQRYEVTNLIVNRIVSALEANGTWSTADSEVRARNRRTARRLLYDMLLVIKGRIDVPSNGSK